MTSRARAVEETRERVLEAAIDLHTERLSSDISLADIAGGRRGERADPAAPLRHPRGAPRGSARAAAREVEEERHAEPGDVTGAVRAVVDHYERRGDGVLLLLAQERSGAFAARVTVHGRAVHRRWVREVFGPLLPHGGPPGRR